MATKRTTKKDTREITAEHIATAPEKVKTEKREKRPPHTKLGGMRANLTVQKIEGYQLRWINDVSDRIAAALEGSYQHVTYDELNGRMIGDTNVVPTSKEMGSMVTKTVGVQKTGHPLVSYLMKIKQEWYDEDQQEKVDGIVSAQDGVLNLEGVDGDLRSSKYGKVTLNR